MSQYKDKEISKGTDCCYLIVGLLLCGTMITGIMVGLMGGLPKNLDLEIEED